MKKILVACAMGVNTSELLADKVKNLLEEEGIYVEIDSSKVNEVASLQDQYDLVISLADIQGLKIPIVVGVNLLTGIKENTVIKEIIEKLNI